MLNKAQALELLSREGWNLYWVPGTKLRERDRYYIRAPRGGHWSVHASAAKAILRDRGETPKMERSY